MTVALSTVALLVACGAPLDSPPADAGTGAASAERQMREAPALAWRFEVSTIEVDADHPLSRADAKLLGVDSSGLLYVYDDYSGSVVAIDR